MSGVAGGVFAAHIVLCLALLIAARRSWSGWFGIFGAPVVRLLLAILEIGSVAIAGDAVLEHDGAPLAAVMLAPFAVLLFWFGRKAGRDGAGPVGIPFLSTPTRLTAGKGLLAGLAVQISILAVTLGILWCLILAEAMFRTLDGQAAWDLTAKSFVTAWPAFAAAAAVSVAIAAVAALVVAMRGRRTS